MNDKRSTSGLPYSQSADRPDGLALVNERLRDVILFAFGLYDFQLTGDPAWGSRDRFDISARADAPLTLEQVCPATAVSPPQMPA